MMTPIQRAGLLAHAASPAFQKKIASARQIIAKHPDYGVSVSWGKDSVVLLHLAASTLKNCKALNIRYKHWAERIKDQDRVRDECLKMLPSIVYYEELSDGMWEMYEKYGINGDGYDDNKKSVLEFNKHFLNAIKKASEKIQINGHFIGMRADESKNRQRLLKMRGKEYTKKNGENICLPLAGWNGTDIWAYHTMHKLPHMLIYDHPVETRNTQRSEIAMASTKSRILSRHGEFTAWRKCYPKEYQAWIERWPELNQ